MTDEEMASRLPSPEMVIQAYEENNLRPVIKQVYQRNGECCAIGALTGRSHTPYHDFVSRFDVEAAGVFGKGFDFGFDPEFARENLDWDQDRENPLVYAHGKKVGKAVRIWWDAKNKSPNSGDSV